MRMLSMAILFAMMALAAAAPTTRPSPAALDKQIAELIVQLDSPDSAVRERATLKLINLGPRVLKPLHDALALEVSPEFASRAKSIIHEITSQWKYVNEIGGNVVGGFQATLQSRTNTFAAGRPISLNLVFCCVGINGHRLAETRTIDIEFDGGPTFTTPQSEGKLIIKKIGDVKLPERATPIICN